MELAVSAVEPEWEDAREYATVTDERFGQVDDQLSDRSNSSPSALQLDVQRGEGLHPDQIVHHAGSVGVVGAVVEAVNGSGRVLEAFVPGRHNHF